MRIEKTCDAPAISVSATFDTIPAGTVFRYGDHNYGPYLRVMTGNVDLKANVFYPQIPTNRFDNYLVLSTARLVLE